MFVQIVLCGEQDAALFCPGNAGGGASPGRAAPQADFDENENVTLAADEIDFAAPAAVIAAQDTQPLPFKKLAGHCLGLPAALARGIFVAHRKPVMMIESPALYVVPTPLGNLGDITQRALAVLREVPWIAAEDTRHSAALLKHYGARGRMLAAHQHNEEVAAVQVVARLDAGESVALISDAGTPAISDPGARIVARVRAAGHRVIPLPGACAAVLALSASGLSETCFLFYGFLPSKAKQREAVLQGLVAQPSALVFYEAPHRILETVAALLAVFGTQRTLVMARELTKLFESIHSCPLGDALAWLEADMNRQRGEFVLLLSGAPARDDDGEGERVLTLLLEEGLPVKQAAKLAHMITGVGKNTLYARALTLKKT